MSKLVHPHGGESLRPLLLAGAALKAELARAKTLPRLRVSSREKGDLIMLGIGGFSPLEGFMTHADWQGVCDGYRMASGLFWPIPITLSASAAMADGINTGSGTRARRPGLGRNPRHHEGEREIRDRQGARVHVGISDHGWRASGRENGSGAGRSQPRRPGQGALRRRLQGEVRRPVHDPGRDRAEFERLGWSKVAAFQTRNPMHRSHEYLAKWPLRCATACWCIRCWARSNPRHPGRSAHAGDLVAGRQVFRQDTVVQAGYPLDMRYAARARRCCTPVPPELRLLAPDRRPRSCRRGQLLWPVRCPSYFRSDPEGVPGDGRRSRFDWTFWCFACGGMASARTCPHEEKDRLNVSGTKLRKWAVRRQPRYGGIQPARGAGDPA